MPVHICVQNFGASTHKTNIQKPTHVLAARWHGIHSLVPHLIGPPSHWSPSHWSPNSLVPQYSIGAHWSPVSLVPHITGPPSHWSPFSFVYPSSANPNGPPSHWSPRLIGPPSQWSPISLVPFSLVPLIHKSPTTLFEPIGPPFHWSPFH